MKMKKNNLNYKAKETNRWIYIFLGIIIMMFLGTVYSYSVFRVSLENKLNIGSVESGMPYMFALAFYALFMFLSGKHIEKYKPRKLILLGGLLVSLGWILSSFSTNIIMLTISYGCIGGAGVGISYGVLMNVTAKWFPDKKGLAVGLILVGFGLSPLVTAPLVRILVENFGVMRAFLILGIVFGILIWLLSIPFKYPGEDDLLGYNIKVIGNEKSIDMTSKDMVKTKEFKGIYLNFIIGTMVGLTMIGMTTNVGIDYFNLNSLTVTRLMAIFAISNGIGRPTFGWITDRFTSKKAMILSYILIIIAAASLILFEKETMLYIITFSIFWFNLGGWLAIVPTSVLKFYGIKNYSQNYGLVFTAYGIGAISGVLSSGILLDLNENYKYVFFYIIILSLIGILLTNKYIRNQTKG